MLQLIRSDLNIDFTRWRTPAMVFSGAITLIGILALILKGGPNYGIDFAGGLLVHVRVDPAVRIEEVRQVADSTQVGAISVQQFESQPCEYLLRVPTADESMGGGIAATLKDGLRAAFASMGFEELRTEMVGPQVGKDLGIAEWLVERISEEQSTIVGIGHGFSFPLRYFETHRLRLDWAAFLDDFELHWPTDDDHTCVDFIRDGSHGNGMARSGNTRWRRLADERAGDQIGLSFRRSGLSGQVHPRWFTVVALHQTAGWRPGSFLAV